MSGKYSLPPFLRRSIYNWDLGKAGSQAHKCLRTIIYVIASEMKCSEAISKTEAIALFRFAPLAMTNIYLILHNYLLMPSCKSPEELKSII